MATGALVVFEEAKAKMISGDWASTDVFNIAICDNTATPAAATAAPVIGLFTQVGTAGTYNANGTSLGTLTSNVTEAAGVMKFDTLEADPTWAQHALNDTDAWWGIVYNFTDAGKDALCFIELGGPVNMSAGALTITFNASGLFTIT